MISFRIPAGSTGIYRRFLLSDSSSLVGAGLSGLLYSSSGLAAYYIRAGATSMTAITLVTATLGTWTSGGFIEIDATHAKGMYEIGFPDALFASGVSFVDVCIYGATNLVPIHIHFDLDPMPSDVTRISGDATAADNLEAAADGTGYNLGGGNIEVSGLTSDRAAALDEVTAVRMGALTDWIEGGRLDLQLDALLARLTETRAELLDNLDAPITSRLAAVDYTAPDNATITAIAAYLDTEIAAIKLKTDTIPVDPAAKGDAMALTSAAVDLVLDEVIEGTITFRQALRILLAVLAGKTSGAPSGPVIFRDIADTKARVTATVDADGNRTAITRDAT